MSSSDQLEELRRLNKCLLEKLSINRDELHKQLSTDCSVRTTTTDDPSQTSTPKTTWNGCGEVPRCPLRSLDRALQTTQGSSSAVRKALCTPKKSHPQETRPHDMSAHIMNLGGSGRGVCSDQGVIKISSPVKRVNILNSTMINPKSAENFSPQYIDRLEDDGNLRNKEARTPKSILLTPNRSSKRDPGRVTFLCNDESPHLETQWSARPLLGYDWIAGLLEVKSPITNKSDQFFAEISEFRRVNQEECAHEYFTESGAQNPSAEDLDLSMDTHQCVYCYRVNQRLFTSPMGAEPACPICKKRRGRRHISLEEPAYIRLVSLSGQVFAVCRHGDAQVCMGAPYTKRVSIPRSTLLPPYKYRAHRRKSFDPTDSLALPSHCLAGWENAVPSCNLKVTSLDLKTSVDPDLVSPPTTINVGMDSSSYYASRATSDNLLNLSRSITFHHRNIK